MPSDTIPEIQFEPDGDCVKLIRPGGAFAFRSRHEMRVILSNLGLGIPKWLYPENDPK